jgi:hypothetical protein
MKPHSMTVTIFTMTVTTTAMAGTFPLPQMDTIPVLQGTPLSLPHHLNPPTAKTARLMNLFPGSGPTGRSTQTMRGGNSVMACVANASTAEPLKQPHGAALRSITGKWCVSYSSLDDFLSYACRFAISAGCSNEHIWFHGQRHFRADAVQLRDSPLCHRAGTLRVLSTLKDLVIIPTIHQLCH